MRNRDGAHYMSDLDIRVEQAVEFFKRNSPDRLGKLIRAVTEKIEAALLGEAIPARVASRIKSPGSLREKLIKWSQDPKKQDRISEPEKTLEFVSDLAAVRVMTYTESDRERVTNLVSKLFSSPPGKADFELEIKEDDPRIKGDDRNHYRATHMMIALKEPDLVGDLGNLAADRCELQITSMLAHVWNEIEHDTIYKSKQGLLSNAERNAINSLGLLTRTGDEIIESLLYARSSRERAEENDRKLNNERFVDHASLEYYLATHFGDKVAGEGIDYKIGSRELLETLRILGWDHPQDVALQLNPARLAEAKKLSRKLVKLPKSRAAFRPQTCDLITISALLASPREVGSAFTSLHGNYRHASLFKDLKAILGEPLN